MSNLVILDIYEVDTVKKKLTNLQLQFWLKDGSPIKYL